MASCSTFKLIYAFHSWLRLQFLPQPISAFVWCSDFSSCRAVPHVACTPHSALDMPWAFGCVKERGTKTNLLFIESICFLQAFLSLILPVSLLPLIWPQEVQCVAWACCCRSWSSLDSCEHLECNIYAIFNRILNHYSLLLLAYYK